MAATPSDNNKELSVTDESDFRYEEKAGRVFMMSQADEVREKVLQRHLKHRLPRKQGLYQLPTRRRSVRTEQDHFYHGQHWDVMGETKPSSNHDDDDADGPPEYAPLNMEHTTRRLTIHAVNEATDAEQHRRIESESRDIKRAGAVLAPVNKELRAIVRKSKKAEKKKERGTIRKVEDKFATVMEQLLHKKHLSELEEEEGEERQRRMRRMEEMTDDDKAQDDEALSADVTAMSKLAKTWCDVRHELEGAFHDLDEVHEEVDHAIDDLFRELKDDFVLSFKRTTHLLKLQALEESERRRRLSVVQELDGEVDPVRGQAIDVKDRTHDELRSAFASVMLDEAEREETGREKSKNLMRDALEELLHVRHSKMADDACAEERKRRIREAEGELKAGRRDRQRERMRDALRAVHEQMILKRFGGKKVKEGKQNKPSKKLIQGESKQDEKLRELRTKARRPSLVQRNIDA